MADTEISKRRQRPVVRLGVLLISHSVLVSVVCCTAGVLALLLLPVLAKNTYISENALMPGSASSMLSNQEVYEANKLIKELTDLPSRYPGAAMAIESRGLIAQYMSNLGAEVNYHKFHPQSNQFNPLHFFSSPDSGVIQENSSCSLYGINTVGVIRAPRGDGKEAIVMVTPYSVNGGLLEALSLGLAYSVFSLLAQVTWLAKDIIWLVADSQYGEYIPVASWLRDYHTPAFSNLGAPNTEVCHDGNNIYELQGNPNTDAKISYSFRRSGTMAAALVLKVAHRNEFEDTLGIYAEASNGQMPNLDLINVVNYLAVHRQGFHVKVEKFHSLLDSQWLKILGEIFEFLGKFVKSLNPKWKLGISTADYVESTSTLASSLYYQALGVPTGPHGAFRDYQVDAITLEMSPRISFDNKERRNDFLLHGGRLIEGVIRSVNNLLEKFHQSFFLYLLTSPSKFVSVGVYMIAFAFLVAPLPVVAASLYAETLDLSKKDKYATYYELGSVLRSWKWLNSAKTAFIVHSWGAIVSLLPYCISQISDSNQTTNFLVWILLSALSLEILWWILGSSSSRNCGQLRPQKEWAILKSVTISSFFIGLGLMSVINFAAAEFGALLMVPTALMAHPLKLDLQGQSLRSFLRAICNLVLGIISFPPATYFVLKGIFEGFNGINAGDFWNWVESLWAWNSATYLYVCMVHLPCWVLCVHILLHPC